MFTQDRHDRQIARWLFLVCGAIFIMLVIGGATRLTHSGLSMVTWDPLLGWIPPMGEAEWLASFANYQKTPEFYKLNPDMTLAGYQDIFLLEYIHRVWGRLIGIFFFVPFLYFLFTGKIKRALRSKLAMIFALGGMQGGLGWYMVQSGLVDDPYVSQYRLTAHLMTAFLIFGYTFWVALDLSRPKQASAPSLYSVTGLQYMLAGLLVWVLVTIASGGFVAGLKAGFTYNTFPLMDGQFIPQGYAMMEPYWRNWFENIPAVQFNHRMMAESTLLIVLVLFLYARHLQLVGRAKLAMHLLMGMTIIQVALGISTLLWIVPTTLGVVHQGGAMVLFSTVIFALHSLKQSR